MNGLRVGVAATMLAVLGAGCSSGDEPAESPPTETVDAVSGQPLSDFEGSPTYEWRKRITADADELLDRMQGIAEVDEGEFRDVVALCDDISRGLAGKSLVERSVVRFSGATQINQGQAQAFIELSREYACP